MITYGNIYQKDLLAIGNDKIYDSTIIGTATLSGLIYGDRVFYYSTFTDQNVNLNKL